MVIYLDNFNYFMKAIYYSLLGQNQWNNEQNAHFVQLHEPTKHWRTWSFFTQDVAQVNWLLKRVKHCSNVW